MVMMSMFGCVGVRLYGCMGACVSERVEAHVYAYCGVYCTRLHGQEETLEYRCVHAFASLGMGVSLWPGAHVSQGNWIT